MSTLKRGTFRSDFVQRATGNQCYIYMYVLISLVLRTYILGFVYSSAFNLWLEAEVVLL